MFRSTAHVATSRPERYQAQLLKHASGMLGRSHGAGPGFVEPAGDTAANFKGSVLTLAWGRCAISISEEMLTLTAEAETLEGLAKIQSGVGGRVATIGRRDQLQVEWSAADQIPDVDPPSSSATSAESSESSRHSHRAFKIAGGALIVLVVLAVHAGIATALLRSPWTWSGAVIVAGVLLGKAALMRHFLRGKAHLKH